MSEPERDPGESEPESEAPPDHGPRRWALPIVLLFLTLLSTLWVGAEMHGVSVASPRDLLAGADFSLPLLAILLTHEMGHYIAGRIHGVDVSPPYFIPMPLTLLGTMGAVIQMRRRIQDTDALLDVGAAGPLAGLAVALPVLVFGLVQSPVQPLPASTEGLIFEGHSILYELLLFATKGPIPAGQDIMLSPTAFAGWAGLLVTMMNLLPVGQLDGGHVAYALLGERQNVLGRRILAGLPFVAIATSGYYVVHALMAGSPITSAAMAGVHWLVWFGVLLALGRFGGLEHPPAGNRPLSPGRRVIAIATLALFVLLFMPSWVRTG